MSITLFDDPITIITIAPSTAAYAVANQLAPTYRDDTDLKEHLYSADDLNEALDLDPEESTFTPAEIEAGVLLQTLCAQHNAAYWRIAKV